MRYIVICLYWDYSKIECFVCDFIYISFLGMFVDFWDFEFEYIVIARRFFVVFCFGNSSVVWSFS